MIRYTRFENSLHHQERVRDLCAAEHESTRTIRGLHQFGKNAVFLLEKTSHSGGKHFLKAAKRRLVAV